MRGADTFTESLFTMRRLDDFVPEQIHQLRLQPWTLNWRVANTGGSAIGPIRQVMVPGLEKVDQLFVLTMAAYNLTRMRTLGQIRQQTTQGA